MAGSGDRQQSGASDETQPDPAHPDRASEAATVPASAGRSSETIEPGFLVGGYRVEEEIGRGSSGCVYSAIEPVIGKRVAVKVLNAALCEQPVAVERFVDEARVVNQIGHPNIVDIFAFGRLEDGRHYFVMEWLAGTTLAARIAQGPIPIDEGIEILRQIVDALEAVHEARLVHRDLKPANIFLATQHRERLGVKLFDFGISKLLGQRRRTEIGAVLGTPAYMAPEQARGHHVGPMTDIYALGVIAYQIFLGRLPFAARNAADAMREHVTADPLAPRSVWAEIPPALEGLLVDMLAKEPAKRPTLPKVRSALSRIHVGPDGGEGGSDATQAVSSRHTALAGGGEAGRSSFALPVRLGRSAWLVVAAIGGVAFVAFLATRNPTAADSEPDQTAVAVQEETANERSDARDVTRPITRPADLQPATSRAPKKGRPGKKPRRGTPSREPLSDPGLVTVNARPWVAVWLDGKRIAAETPLRRHSLTPGRHELRLTNSAAGFDTTRTVDVRPGKTVDIFVDVVTGEVTIH